LIGAHIIEDKESAVIGIGRKTNVGNETIAARRHPNSILPWRSKDKNAPAIATACPTTLILYHEECGQGVLLGNLVAPHFLARDLSVAGVG
jgi:hypothetical protein